MGIKIKHKTVEKTESVKYRLNETESERETEIGRKYRKVGIRMCGRYRQLKRRR